MEAAVSSSTGLPSSCANTATRWRSFISPSSERPTRFSLNICPTACSSLTQSADRLIAIRPPAHLIPHPNKIVWFIHHLRQFYDLWDSPYRDFPDDRKHRAIRTRVVEADQVALGEARRLFTNSQVVSNRLLAYNNMKSEVLYPPLLESDRFECRKYGNDIVCLSRVEHHKRQHLLIQAFGHVRTRARLRICGVGSNPSYVKELQALIAKNNARNRISFENRWISEEEKREILADALFTAYLPLDEDSYGYPSLEASCARKGILTTTDAGGVGELVQDRRNGRVVDPEPKAIAAAIDEIYEDRESARSMGQAARQRLDELRINWDHVIARLLS